MIAMIAADWDRHVRGNDERIARVLSRQGASERDVGRELSFKILEAVNREIDALHRPVGSSETSAYQAIGSQIEAAAGKGFMTTNWMEQNRALFRALRLERVVTFITIGLIVFVAALNILISLIMMVMEKTRDIAVLVSMGARRQ